MNKNIKKLRALSYRYANALYLDLFTITEELQSIYPWIHFETQAHGDTPEEPDYLTLKMTEPRPLTKDVPTISDTEKIYLYGLLSLISETMNQDVRPCFTASFEFTETKSIITYTFPCNYGS